MRRYIRAPEYGSALNGKAFPTPARTWYLEDNRLGEIRHHKKTRTDNSTRVRLREGSNRGSQGPREVHGELESNGARVSVWDNERVREMDDGYKTT